MTRPQDSYDTEVDDEDANGSLGRMLFDLAEHERTEFEHERISCSIRHRLFGLGSPLRIGPYPVMKLLGAGGMGEVYECRDEQLDRTVAVKLVRGAPGKQGQEALAREAKAMAKLAHPNVVTVFEVGAAADRTFIVMEYVRGQTLAAWLRDNPPWRAVLSCFVAAGRGLAAAHRAGLVHRDFKPDNVLLGRDGSVKVTDFGLALTERQVAAQSKGPPAGTSRYMSPEQLHGGALDARSDQFAFCSALYEGLWGELPFVGIERDAPKPPKRSRGLWPVVRRGLAPAPDDRWPSMDALLGALERVPKRARRLGWSLTGTLAAASFTGLFVASRGDVCEAVAHDLDGVWDDTRRAELERQLATLDVGHAPDSTQRVLASLDAWSSNWLSEREQACRAHGARAGDRSALLAREDCLDRQRMDVRRIVDALDQSDHTTLAQAVVVLDEFSAPSTCLDSSFSPITAPRLEQSFAVEQLRSELDRTTQLRRMGSLEQALEQARTIDTIARTIDHGPIRAEARAELAKAEDEAGTPERSAARYDEAIDLAEIHHLDRLSAQLWIERAELSLFDLRDLARGELWLHRAEVAQARVGTADIRTRARFAFGRARVAELGHDRTAARAGYAEALALAREIASADVPTYASNLARVVDSDTDALALHREAVAFAEAHWGPKHPRTAKPLFNLGLALNRAGLDGERELATAAAIWFDVHDLAHPMLAQAYVVLGDAALRRGDLELAEDHARTLAAIQAEVLPERDPSRGVPDQMLALIEGIRGNHEAALAHAVAARARFELAGPADPGALRMTREAANQLLALARLDEAAAELERALELTRDPGQVQQTRIILAEVALRRGRLPDADVQLRAVAALELELRDHALSYEVLRTLVDHRLGRLEPSQRERVLSAREASPLTDQQLAAWFDELELSDVERRLFESR